MGRISPPREECPSVPSGARSIGAGVWQMNRAARVKCWRWRLSMVMMVSVVIHEFTRNNIIEQMGQKFKGPWDGRAE